MSEELRDDPFFGDRVIKYVESLIRGSYTLNPIDDFEKRLEKNRHSLVLLNKEVDGGLSQLLRNTQDFIPPRSALRMLLHLQKYDLIEEGITICRWAERDNMHYSDHELNELVKAVRKDPEVPLVFHMTVNEKYVPVEDTSMKKEKPRLNLPSDFS